MVKKTRIIALVIGITFFSMILLFISVEAHHPCVGDHCSICLELKACITYLQLLSALPLLLSLLRLFSLSIFVARKYPLALSALLSPAELRVKLNL